MLDDMIRRESLTRIRHSLTAFHVHPDVPLHGLPWYLHIFSRSYCDNCSATRDHRTYLIHYLGQVCNVREAPMESL